MTGPKPFSALLVFLSINIVSVLFVAFPWVFYIKESNPIPFLLALFLVGSADISLILWVFTDPGVVPMHKDPDFHAMKPNFVLTNGSLVKLKYWYTCHIMRPPRAVHCSQCDWWILRMDHHWPWLGCCIGKRNYLYFFLFITSLALYSIVGTVVWITYWIDLVNKKKNDLGLGSGKAFGEAMKESPLVIPMILLGFFIGIFLVLLFIYHIKILIQGRTTHEDIKESKIHKVHPYDYFSMFKNIYSGLFTGFHNPLFIPREIYVETDTAADMHLKQGMICKIYFEELI